MIRLLNEKDRFKVLDYLYQEAEYNIFLIGDIETFGFDQKFQRVYGEFDDFNTLLSVFLRYYENAVFYSHINHFNLDYLDIFKKDPFDYISGKSSIMEKIDPYLKNYHLERMFFCSANQLINNDDENFKFDQLKTEEDAGKLYDFLVGIDEFGIDRKDKNHFIESKMKALNMGITLYIEKDNHIISTVSTTAETTKNAMVVAVATLESERHQGYASKLMKQLMKIYLEDKKKSLCLFYNNPEAGKIYLRLGFVNLGTWDMYKIK